MNYLLALETSGKAGSVAVADRHANELEAKCRLLPEDKGSAQSLVPCIDELLKEYRITSADLGCIALLSGPGSFTGLRVGVATAKTMAYALKIPIVELDTLDVIYRQFEQLATGLGPYVHCMLDAYRGQLFVRTFVSRQSPAVEKVASARSENPTGDAELDERLGAMAVTRVIDIVDFLAQAKSLSSDAREHVFVGPGCERLKRFFAKDGAECDLAVWAKDAEWLDGEALFPNATTVAQLGMKLWESNTFVDPFQLVPDYFRASAAEEKAKSHA